MFMTELTEQAAKRIDALRAHALGAHGGLSSRENDFYYLDGWIDARFCGSHILRRARAIERKLDRATPVIDDGELIVGKPCYRELTEAEEKLCSRRIDAAMPDISGQASHMAIDYEKLLRLGLSGIRAEADARRAALDLSVPENLARCDFYRACSVVLSALSRYAERYAAYASSLAEAEQRPARRAELVEIASTLRRVPELPARTYREALQCVQFVTFSLSGLYQLGRPDRYLYKYYQSDLACGRITPQDALELICCRDILDSEYIPSGLAIGYMVGGRGENGAYVANELTYLHLISIGCVRLAYPGVGLCCAPEMPEELLRLAVKQLESGCTHPALFNDEVITRGLLRYGMTPAEACNYTHSTCVEITPCACSAVWVASPYINLAQLLLDEIFAVAGGSLASPPSFEAFLEAYRERLNAKIRAEAEDQNRKQLLRMHCGCDPLVSCFVNDCLERGLDIDMGGARHNAIMPSFVGMANLTDSLVVIRDLVYGGELGFSDLADALRNGFGNAAALRARIVGRLPKYGNDDDSVDPLVQRICDMITSSLAPLVTARGDRFIPSLFCWVMHTEFGKCTGATPDGRMAGFPLGDGSGPAQGREANGPTASVLSSTKWDHTPFIGGVAVNLKFARSTLSGESEDKLLTLVKTYLRRGGFELQINVCDRAALLAAVEHPEQYADLVVRIGGYSDYFVRLQPEMQREVIERTEHDAS